MIKVLHFTRHFFPEYSGTSTRLYNLLCRLPSSMCIVTSNRKITRETIPAATDRFDNIEVRRVPIAAASSLDIIPGWHYLQTMIDYYRGHRKTIMTTTGNEPWDLIHTHNLLPFARDGGRLADKQHVPNVFELHGIAEESLSGIARFAGSFYLRKETQRMFGKAAHAITLTQSLKKWLCARYKVTPEKVTVVPNGADIETFSPKDEYKKRAAKLKGESGIAGKVVMYAGAMDRINGLDDMVTVIPRIIKERPLTSFVFIGSGPELPKLLGLAAAYPQNVKCISQVPYAEMPVYYQMCDIFIIPRPSTISSETLTPLKLLEAMASARPVLGSNVGGIAEVIQHGANGYLYHKDDLTSLKNTLLEALETDNIPVSQNARNTVTRSYTWERSSQVLWQIYKDLV